MSDGDNKAHPIGTYCRDCAARLGATSRIELDANPQKCESCGKSY